MKKQLIKKNIKQITLAVSISVLTATSAQAQSYDDGFYYEIGGGQLADPGLSGWNEFTLDLDPYLGTQYTCGDFDFNRIDSSVNKGYLEHS